MVGGGCQKTGILLISIFNNLFRCYCFSVCSLLIYAISTSLSCIFQEELSLNQPNLQIYVPVLQVSYL